MERVFTFEEKKKRLNDYECHFKWKPQGDKCTIDINKFESKLLTNIQENPVIEVQALTLLSYIHSGSIDPSKTDYMKALDYVDQAMSKAQYNGDKYVIKSNKLHILLISRKRAKFEEEFSEVYGYIQRLDDFDRCRIKLIEAYALTRFGIEEYKRALDIYEQAKILCPLSPDAHFGIGLVLGRLRRNRHGHISKPSQQEMNSFKTSMKLFDSKNPFAVVKYAYALICDVRSFKGPFNPYYIGVLTSICHEAIDLLKSAINLADTFSDRSCIVYKWCAKGYKRLCLSNKPAFYLPRRLYLECLEKQEFCNDKACKANPNDSGAYHEAGLFYWRVKQKQDLPKAKTLLEKACQLSPTGNILADIDFVYFCKRHEEDYSAICRFSELLNKYQSTNRDKLDIAILYFAIAKEIIQEEGYESAQSDLVEAVKLDPEGHKTSKAKKILLNRILVPKKKILVTKMQNSTLSDEETDNFIQVLRVLGEIYEFTDCGILSAECYEKLLSIEQTNSEIVLKLSGIYYNLKDYQKCIDICNKETRDSTFGNDLWKLKAKSYYYLANESGQDLHGIISQDCSLNQNMLRSAQHGLLEGCTEVISAISKTLENDLWFHRSIRFYEQCAFLLIPSEYFLLAGNNCAPGDISNLNSKVTSLIEESQIESIHSDLIPDLIALRQKRFEMTLKKTKVSNDEAMQVLLEARNELDRSFKQFVDIHFSDVKRKRKVYYPYLSAPMIAPNKTNPDLRKSQEGVEKRLESPKDGMGLANFKERFLDLFDFLAKHQPVFDPKYNFLPVFCAQVNIHKHAKNMNGEELYETAHFACEYVEEVLLELSKYFP